MDNISVRAMAKGNNGICPLCKRVINRCLRHVALLLQIYLVHTESDEIRNVIFEEGGRGQFKGTVVLLGCKDNESVKQR